MKAKDWQKGRDDGLALALKIVREGGVEALEEEIRARGAMGLQTSLTMKELDDAGIMYKENALIRCLRWLWRRSMTNSGSVQKDCRDSSTDSDSRQAAWVLL